MNLFDSILMPGRRLEQHGPPLMVGPHLPGYSPAGAFTGRLLWVGCGSATEALTLFNLYPEGGQATLVEVQPDLARHLGGALAGKVPKCQTC